MLLVSSALLTTLLQNGGIVYALGITKPKPWVFARPIFSWMQRQARYRSCCVAKFVESGGIKRDGANICEREPLLALRLSGREQCVAAEW